MSNGGPTSSRRAFLIRSGGVVLGAVVLEAGLVAEVGSQGPTPHAAPVCFPGGCPRIAPVFDAHTFATLEQVAEQIVPTDADPGGLELCAATLVEVIASGSPDTVAFLTSGLAGLDESSTLLFGGLFKTLTFDQQRTVLQRLEAGTAPGPSWSSKKPTPPGHQKIAATLSRHGPAVGPVGRGHAHLTESTAQQMVFATLRTFCKLAFLTNFPETQVRDPAGRPIFADSAHLIFDPDQTATRTGWTILKYHVVDYETEKLLWEWQAGKAVTGFNGIPVLGPADLSDVQRETAK